MEVHAHTHTERKKWTHYLWEFLMLFLAVFCGFLAENLREHLIEHKREKQFIQSLVHDIEMDTIRLNYIMAGRNRRELRMDSLSRLINLPEPAPYSRYIYYLNASATRGIGLRFIPNDGTMQQLKNAGNLRLIRDPAVRDSITAYDVAV